jgi:hypothetical protein
MVYSDKVLFVCHAGTSPGGGEIGLLQQDTSLPIACAGTSENTPGGFHSLWEAVVNAEIFFICAMGPGCLDGAVGEPNNGLWVLEAEWSDSEEPEQVGDADKPEAWEHLRGGRGCRRPAAKELAALGRGECPWKGGVLL